MQGNSERARKIIPMNSRAWRHQWFVRLGIAALWAATAMGCSAANNDSSTVHFNQSVYVDESRQLDIQAVQQVTFKPMDYTDKLDFSDSVVWLKLEQVQPSDSTVDWYLKFLPAMLTEATVYVPDAFMSDEWQVQTYTANALALPLRLGPNPNHGAIYMRLRSPLDFRMNLMVDAKDKIDFVQRRVDMFVIMVTTMTLLALVLALVRLVIKFNWLSVGIASLSICIPSAWISCMGMLPFLTGIDQQFFHRIFPLAMMGGMVSFFFIWMVLATQLFKGGQWIKYLWIFFAALALVWLGGLFDTSIAMLLAENIYRYGQWVCFAVLLLQAFQARHQLKLPSEIGLFVLLLLFMLTPYPSAANLFKPFVNPFGLGDMPMISLFMLIRTSLPLAVLVLTAWTFDLLVSQRVKKINTQLAVTQDALDKESARLKLQKQFITMLTHELKNPLMASSMALGSIRQRLLEDEQSLQRVQAISYSLDEIDSIIERCSEIDKYEQGSIPLSIEPVALGVILSVVKNAQTSERIYSIVRGCDEHQLINTDIYYVKAILNNLLNNALKYAVPETLVEFKVETRQQGAQSEIVFTVSNEVLPDGAPDPDMVFQRYYRAEWAKQHSGAGLGLWLAQSMAHALGTELHYTHAQNMVTFHFAIKA